MQKITSILYLSLICCCGRQASLNVPIVPAPEQFRYSNLRIAKIDSNEFHMLSDGALFKDTSKWGHNRTLDSTMYTRKYFLHSWQGTIGSVNLFPVLSGAMGEFLEIKLIGMDKAGKVMFTNRIANMGGEPGAFNYESWAHWKSIDTITVTSIRKFTRGFLMPADWKGLDTDTLIQEIVIAPAGSIDSKLTDSVFHSRKFLDTADWSYR